MKEEDVGERREEGIYTKSHLHWLIIPKTYYKWKVSINGRY